MNTVTRFFLTVWSSATSPTSYNQRLTESLSTAFGYLYWLVVCTTFIASVVLAGFYIAFRPIIAEFSQTAVEQIRDAYPAELVLTLEDNELRANVEQPFSIDPPFWTALIDMPAEEKSENNMGKNDKDMHDAPPLHLVTIDTENGSADTFRQYETAVLLTRTSLVVFDDKSIRVIPYADMDIDSFILDKATYDKGIDALQPLVAGLPAMLDILVLCMVFIGPFVGGFFLWLWWLVWLLILTLFTLLIARIMKRSLDYRQLYKLGLYGLTLPLIFKLIAGWLPIPFLGGLIFLIWMGIVLSTFPKKGEKKAAVKTKKR